MAETKSEFIHVSEISKPQSTNPAHSAAVKDGVFHLRSGPALDGEFLPVVAMHPDDVAETSASMRQLEKERAHASSPVSSVGISSTSSVSSSRLVTTEVTRFLANIGRVYEGHVRDGQRPQYLRRQKRALSV